MKTILATLLVITILIGGFAAYALQPATRTASWSADLPTIQSLAAAPPEQLPASIQYHRVATVSFPGFLIETGGKLGWRALTVFSYQITYPDGSFVIVDAGTDSASLDAIAPRYTFEPETFNRMQKLLPEARAIVVTHEHYDHCAGLAAHPAMEQFAERVFLTEAQLTNSRTAMCGFSTSQRQRLQPLVYDELHTIAPGIVLIKAPGHTPGSQMVFVQLGNGQQFLFAGDIGWVMGNIDGVQPHPRLTNWLVQEDAAAMRAQLGFLDKVVREHPDTHVVPGHDDRVVKTLTTEGALIPAQ